MLFVEGEGAWDKFDVGAVLLECLQCHVGYSCLEGFHLQVVVAGALGKDGYAFAIVESSAGL